MHSFINWVFSSLVEIPWVNNWAHGRTHCNCQVRLDNPITKHSFLFVDGCEFWPYVEKYINIFNNNIYSIQFYLLVLFTLIKVLELFFKLMKKKDILKDFYLIFNHTMLSDKLLFSLFRCPIFWLHYKRASMLSFMDGHSFLIGWVRV